jgi:hypothetical protein
MEFLHSFQWYHLLSNAISSILHHMCINHYLLFLVLHLILQDGSKSLCKGNPSSAIASANSLRKIRSVQKGPQKRIAWDNELLYIPKEGIMETLRSFLDQFLSGGYNGNLIIFVYQTITVF